MSLAHQRPLWDAFDAVSRSFPHKIAVQDAYSGKSVSYAELRRCAIAMGEGLLSSPYRTVVIVGEPTIEGLSVLFACAYAGRCCVPISSTPAGSSLLATLITLPSAALVLSWRSVPDLPLAQVHKSLKLADAFWYQSTPSAIPSEDRLHPFLVTQSSGSTGRPKWVAIDQEIKLRRTQQSIDLFRISDGDMLLSASPLHHSLGQRHLLIALLTGATLVRSYPFGVTAWVQAVARYQPTISIPVATHLKILAPVLIETPALLQSFRVLVTSSAPADEGFKTKILNNGDFEFWEIYGMTETACATAVRYEHGDSTGHVGRALPNCSVRLSEEGANGVGEIEVSGDYLCNGYWGDNQRWENSLTQDGFFKSGDLGRFDDCGNLVYVGRANESFQSAGLVVYPQAIEEVVLKIPGVANCVVIGVPDPVFDNLIGVVFCGDKCLTELNLMRACRERLPKHLWPARFRRLSDFPLLPSGKVDRQTLKGCFSD
jgi:long-chain acyl-CoA synthetase